MSANKPGIADRLVNIFASMIQSSGTKTAPLTQKDFYSEKPDYLKDLYEEEYDPAKDPGNPWAGRREKVEDDPKVEMSLLHEMAATGDLAEIQHYLINIPEASLSDTNAGGKTPADIAHENGHAFVAQCLDILARHPALKNMFCTNDHDGLVSIMDRMSQEEREETLLDAARIGMTDYLIELAIHHPETDLTCENEKEGKSPFEIARAAGHEDFAAFLHDLMYPVKKEFKTGKLLEPMETALQRAYDSGDERRVHLIERSLADNGYTIRIPQNTPEIPPQRNMKNESTGATIADDCVAKEIKAKPDIKAFGL